MDSIVEMVPSWDKAVFGFNQGTIVVLLGLIAVVFVARIFAMMVIPIIFSKICEKSPVAKLAIQGSSKALGTATGAAILWQSSLTLIEGESVLMTEFDAF